jgi:Ras GTPase-activating-like protein IQGAP2/3
MTCSHNNHNFYNLLPYVTNPQAFLSDLCEVSDFHEQLQLEEYIAVSRKDIAIEISLSEIATLHDLLVKYKEDIVSSLICIISN